MEAYYTTSRTPEGKLKVTYADGYSHELSGERARAMGNSEADLAWQEKNPTLAAANRFGHTDDRNSFSRDLGTLFSRFAEENKGEPSFMDNGAAYGALAGGAGGAMLGGGLSAVYNLLSGGNTNPGIWAALAGMTGAVLGGLNSDVRVRANKEAQGLTNQPTPDAQSGAVKSAAMYKDPRNFILEKLQSADDVTIGQKAILAAKVRAMAVTDAERLSKAVRAAVGFGVGALISKFFFGTGTVGTALGGLIGLAGYNVLSGVFAKPAPITFNKTITYRDLL